MAAQTVAQSSAPTPHLSTEPVWTSTAKAVDIPPTTPKTPCKTPNVKTSLPIRMILAGCRVGSLSDAGGGTRTPKSVSPPAPKAGASASFATPA
jgi:hypothetical protein